MSQQCWQKDMAVWSCCYIEAALSLRHHSYGTEPVHRNLNRTDRSLWYGRPLDLDWEKIVGSQKRELVTARKEETRAGIVRSKTGHRGKNTAKRFRQHSGSLEGIHDMYHAAAATLY